MAQEQISIQDAQKTEVLTAERETEQHVPKHAVEMGRRALEFNGFIVLEMVESPYEGMRRELESAIIDQPAAIDAIIEAMERSEDRLAGDSRPIANFAFLGPTGVGKSEVAKLLSRLIGEDGGNLLKIDCSNFSNGHEVTLLLGSPPSYVGHQQVPRLSKEAVEVPGTVVLFDEIEKGSEGLYNIMLQIMGDGKLGLNNGDIVDFSDTVVIMTSNLGAKEMSAQLSPVQLGFTEKNRTTDKEKIEGLARNGFIEYFSPEFVNRLNKMVVFHPLSEDGLAEILDVKLRELNDSYEKYHGVRVSLSDATKAELVSIAAQEPQNGARPLVRAIEDNIQSTFGRYRGSGIITEGTHVRVIHDSELPDGYSRDTSSPFVFTAQIDTNIRKQQRVFALPAAEIDSTDVEPRADNEPDDNEA